MLAAPGWRPAHTTGGCRCCGPCPPAWREVPLIDIDSGSWQETHLVIPGLGVALVALIWTHLVGGLPDGPSLFSPRLDRSAITLRCLLDRPLRRSELWLREPARRRR